MKKYNEFRPLIKGGRNLVDERELGILRLRGDTHYFKCVKRY